MKQMIETDLLPDYFIMKLLCVGVNCLHAGMSTLVTRDAVADTAVLSCTK